MPKFSVIIPCHTKKELCPELLPALKSQSLKAQEILVITDRLCPGSPGDKRDFGARRAKGSILAFLDSDAYPDQDWLKRAASLLRPTFLAAVCGPGLTPESDSPRQQLSGLVCSSRLGVGPYYYRARQATPRFVDDYPSFNLLVKKDAFLKAGGFNTAYWPGEDTKLCLDLIYKLDKKILYHPDLVVYHHRRPVFRAHLAQISRYGYQRGRFVRLFPRTSRRLRYFLPFLFLLFLPLTFPLYLLTLLFTSLSHHSPLLAPTLLLTHLVYSLNFTRGLLSQLNA